MNDQAIAWKTDEHFTEGKRYECINTYQNFVDILDNNGETIKVELDDKDFTFILNPVTDEHISEEEKEIINQFAKLNKER